MSQALELDILEMLPHTSASDIKKLGWRGIMKMIRSTGKVVVTNHNEPEAVILSAKEYDIIQHTLQETAQNDHIILNTLRQQFDVRLASLTTADAGDRLREVMRRPAELVGNIPHILPA